jgi:hypothetical protein
VPLPFGGDVGVFHILRHHTLCVVERSVEGDSGAHNLGIIIRALIEHGHNHALQFVVKDRVLEGSEIAEIGSRVDESLIGRDVRIYKCPPKPSVYRFMVGDKSEIGIK